MTNSEYAAGSQRLGRFFLRRGIAPAAAQDLTQDTWIRYLEARQRGALQRDGLEPLGKMAGWVLNDHRTRRSSCEEVTGTGDFTEEAGLIQLQPEGGYRRPRQKVSTRSLEVQAAVVADCAAGMSRREAARKYGIPVGSINRIVQGASC